MVNPAHPQTSPVKPLRSDGVEARNRLLDAALKLFADKGFSQTSTREIAQAAQANLASISYYFGDKEGLYRAVFEDPRFNHGIDPTAEALADGDIRTIVDFMLRGFTEPLKAGEQAQQCMKLHFREMVEPTGMWQEEIEKNIKPAHLALVTALCRHLQVNTADDDMHRLGFELLSMGVMLHVGTDVIRCIRPALIADSAALDQYHARMVDNAMVLIAAEARRRSIHSPGAQASEHKTQT